MARADFESKYWVNFDKEHRVRAEAIWTAAHGTKESDPKYTELTTPAKDLELSMRRSGLIPKDKTVSKMPIEKQDFYAKMEQQTQKALNDFEMTALQGKRKATPEERQNIIDAEIRKTVFVDDN